MRRVMETSLGLLLLTAQLVRTRFPFRRRYWDWRMETAFGRFPIGRRARIRAVLEYARWVYQMQRRR